MYVPIMNIRAYAYRLSVAAVILGLAVSPSLGTAEWHVVAGAAVGGSGSLGSPFATIAQGLAVAQPGDTVSLHAGTYRERIQPPRSGTVLAPITIQAWSPDGNPWNRESVTVSALRIVTPGAAGFGTWMSQSGGRWSLALPSSAAIADGFNCALVDGVPMVEARWPDAPADDQYSRTHTALSTAGSLVATNVSGSLDRGSYTCPDLTVFSADAWVGARMRFNPGLMWFNQQAVVESKTGNQIVFLWPAAGEFGASALQPDVQDWFVLSGRLVALSGPGEAYFDLTGVDSGSVPRTLWLQRTADPTASVVETRASNEVASLSGISNLALVGLRFLGGTVSTSAISSRLRFTDCTFALNSPSWAQDTALKLVGTDHVATGCDFQGGRGAGVTIGNDTTGSTSRVTVNDSTFSNYAESGIQCNVPDTVTVRNCTVHSTGAHGVTFNAYNSDFDRLHVYQWGRTCADVAGINSYYNLTAKLQTRVHHCWVYDNQAYAPVGGRWFAGAGMRGDSGGNTGIAGYTLDHNIIKPGQGPAIALFALDPGQNGYGAADILIANNSCTGAIQSVATGSNVQGMQAINNVTSNLIDGSGLTPLTRADHNLLTDLASSASPEFLDLFGGDLTPASGSALIDAGASDVAHATSGAIGTPDIGAIEYGSATWLAGASVRARHLPALQLVGRTAHDGSRWAVVRNLPAGRLLPVAARLRLGATIFSNGLWTYDPANHAGEAWFALGSATPAEGSAASIDLGDGTFVNLTSAATGLRSTVTAIVINGGTLTASGLGLDGPTADRYRLQLAGLVGADFVSRPVAMRVGAGALGINASAGDLAVELAIGAQRGELALQIERFASNIVQGWATPTTPTTGLGVFGSALRTAPYAYRASSPTRQSLDSTTWPMLTAAFLRLKPESLALSDGATITAWDDTPHSASFTAPSVDRQPTFVLSGLAGLPAVYFANDGLAWTSGLADGPVTFMTTYRNVSSVSATPSPGNFQRLVSSGPDPDYINGAVTIITTNPDGSPIAVANPTLSYISKSTTVSRSPIRLGRNANPVTGEAFTGWMGETLAWNRSITPAEIRQLREYYGCKYRTIPSGLLGGSPTAPAVRGITATFNGTPIAIRSASDTRLVFDAPSGSSGSLIVSLPGSSVQAVLNPDSTTSPGSSLSLSGLSVVYDGLTHAASATVVPAGPTVSFTYNGSATPPTAVGNYAVVATSSGGMTASGTLVISPRALNLTGATTTATAGSPLPTPSGSVSGLVAGDGITVVWTTAAPNPTVVGSWSVTGVITDPSSKLGNYLVHNIPGTITVTASSGSGSGSESGGGGGGGGGGICGLGGATSLILGLGLLAALHRRRAGH